MSHADEPFEVVEKPKRVSRKRVPKVVDEVSMPIVLSPKRASRNKVSSDSADDTPKPTRQTRSQKTVATERKAPTPIAATKEATKTSRRQAMVVGALILLGVSASAIVGFTDKGSINVEKTIAERNDRISRGEIQGEVVPVQNTPQVANGGMVGLGSAGQENVASSSAPTATSTASSTPAGQTPATTAEAEVSKAAAQAAASSSQSSP